MALPEITLTDPNNLDSAPQRAQSPIKPASAFPHISARVAAARPDTSGGRNGNARPESPSGWASPSRLIKSMAANGNAHAQNGAQSEEANGHGNGNDTSEGHTAIDPLTQHILQRTNAPLTIPTTSPRPRSSDDGSTNRDEKRSREPSPAPAVQEPLSRTDTAATAHRDLKKGVKAVTFLSRLMGAKKKDAEAEAIDDRESTTSEGRPEGNDAEVFAQPVDNMGFSPRLPQPPAYIKVRSKHKKERDFDRLFLAQELECRARPPAVTRRDSSNKLRRKSSAGPQQDGSTVWAMEFSRNGKYLAAAGADKVVRVWAVLSSSEDRQRHEQQEFAESEATGTDTRAGHLSAPVFQSNPIREFQGHTSTVLDLSWSKNDFLLSSSMDKTVRLWHVSRAECLCTFKHNDFVPSIAFHPKDDRFFLAGSLDSRLRLWSIPDKNVAYSVQVPDMITAVAFTPDGKAAMAGCLSGLCMFYETEGLKYQTQIHVRSSRGQNAKGSKITGITALYGASGDVKVLITSNDSRIRLYNFRDKSLELKFKGHENNCSQIRAALSDDGRYVVCGSEDRKAYVWSLNNHHQQHGEKRDRIPVEMFEAHDSITTAVCVAPTRTRQLLARAEDPVYDLCNPPPVTLRSRAEAQRTGSPASSRPPTENGSVRTPPIDASAPTVEKALPSPAYLSRSAHKSGPILVTADFTGRIKVFRQDCAWAQRRQTTDDWERSSLFTKRASRASTRQGSLGTRASQRSLREAVGRSSTSTQATTGTQAAPPEERILSWRQGIASSPSVAEGAAGRAAGKVNGGGATRSPSPRKSLDRGTKPETPPAKNGDAAARSAHPLAGDVMVRSPSPINHTATNNGDSSSPSPRRREAARHDADNPLHPEASASYSYWDAARWKSRQRHLQAQRDSPPAALDSAGDDRDHDHDHLAVRPPLREAISHVSELSDERSSGGEEEEYDDAREEMACGRCGEESFSAMRGRDGVRLVCVRCGSLGGRA